MSGPKPKHSLPGALIDLTACFLIPAYTLLFAGSRQWFSTNFSVIAVMGVVIPALLTVTEPLGISSMAVSLIVYMAIASHYVLPFHHLDILVGVGEENGMFTEKETIRFGLPFIIPVFALVIVQVAWWSLLNVI